MSAPIIETCEVPCNDIVNNYFQTKFVDASKKSVGK